MYTLCVTEAVANYLALFPQLYWRLSDSRSLRIQKFHNVRKSDSYKQQKIKFSIKIQSYFCYDL